ncbi:Ctr copper transporter [Zopfochytrium polystomum]|nr:Ctr copper transporter [Zopfochytrium polystomum]
MNSADAPPMRPYLHASSSEYVLFSTFVPTTGLQFFGACCLAFFIALAATKVSRVRRRWVELRKAWVLANPVVVFASKGAESDDDGDLSVLLQGAAAGTAVGTAVGTATTTSTTTATDSKAAATAVLPPSTSSTLTLASGDAATASVASSSSSSSSSSSQPKPSGTPPYRRPLPRVLLNVFTTDSLLRGLEVALSYLAMLLVMQFNVYLLLSAVAGALAGTWLYEWDEKEEREVVCCNTSSTSSSSGGVTD